MTRYEKKIPCRNALTEYGWRFNNNIDAAEF